LDLIKSGTFALKKVDPNAPLGPKIIPDAPMSHLDLIKTGTFALKKVDRTQPLPPGPKPKFEKEEDPSALTLQDILQKAASIREAVACSDSSESGSEKSESTAW
jgi:hypothetical protein